VEEKKIINYEDNKNVKDFHSDYEGEEKTECVNTKVERKSSSKRKKIKPILLKKNFDQDGNLELSPDKRNSLKTKKKVTPIIMRNINEISEMQQTYKKTGVKKVPKERKKVQKKKDQLCEKFAKNPLKFFTSPTKSLEVEELDCKHKSKSDRLRNCNSEKVFKSNKHNNTTFDIIQNLRYDNLSRQEKEDILKNVAIKLNIESPYSQLESKTEDNVVNISYMSEPNVENGKDSGKELSH